MRLAIITDIHEDIISLQKALDRILKLNIDKIICLGDIVGFEKNHYNFEKTRSAQTCVKLLQKHTDIAVTGNHDLLAIKKIPCFNKQIGFPKNWYDMPMQEKESDFDQVFFLYKDEEENDLGETEENFLKNLDFWKVLEANKKNVLFSHFIYPDINGNKAIFTNNKRGFSKHFEWMNELNTIISFVGHAHMEGVGIAKKRGFKIEKFGIYSLKDEPQIILCPSIADGKRKNGFVLFDTETMTLEVLAL